MSESNVPESAREDRLDETTSDGSDEQGRPEVRSVRGRRRLKFERGVMRLLATVGIVGLDVALGAILTSNHVAGWIIGLVEGLVSVVLAAILWSSRQP